jgi:glycosyltransferase involved in cell wall biosynthesis
VNDAVETRDPGLLYVLPTFLGRSAAIEAAWLAAADFASAVGARVGGTDLLSPRGLLDPQEVMALSVRGITKPSAMRAIARALPRPASMALNEVRSWYRGQEMRTLARRKTQRTYRLVVQLHRRYQDCGLRVSRKLGVPFILRIEALEVRQDVSWGLRRPMWGAVAERWGELAIIRQADLVAAVSDVLDAQLARMGVPQERRVVIPNGVDLTLFSPGDRDVDLLRAHDLEGRFVVGWVGGFRPFHGLDALPEIAHRLRSEIPSSVLCLVGTGPERDELGRRARGMGDVIRFVGPVARVDVPRWLRSFHACLLLARSTDFHYSPMKLYEYMGCGRPVVAAAVGEVRKVISDGHDGLLVPPHHTGAVVDAIARLFRDDALRDRLGAAARRTAERSGSWESRAVALLAALESRQLFPSPNGHPA